VVPRVQKFGCPALKLCTGALGKSEISLTEICNRLHIAFRLSPFFQKTSLFPPAPSFIPFSAVSGFTKKLHYRYVLLLLHK